MKQKSIISAVVGATFFAIPYLGLSLAVLPSLGMGVLAFGASELIFTPRDSSRLKDNNPSLYKKIEEAKKQNTEIKNMISHIEDDKTRKALENIYNTVIKIIDRIEKNPKKAKQIHNFFDYYLPVLLSIIKRYDEIENQKLISQESKEFMGSASKMIWEASEAFNNILASLYQSELVDVAAEMKVFNAMLKTDGIVENELSKKVKENTNER